MSYYESVPEAQRRVLLEFRQRHPPRTDTINGLTWEYIDTGGDKPPLLVLVGGLRVADAAFQAITVLEKDFRIIAPTYPALDTMKELVDGLASVLAAAAIKQTHILAGSYGGMIAQVLVREYPKRVNKLVLSSTGILDEETLKNYKQTARLLSIAPQSMVKNRTKKRMIEIIAPPEDQLQFWEAFLEELYNDRVGKREILSTFESMIDFVENYDLEPWRGETLIFGAEDDATFNAATRASLLPLYPNAQVHIFQNAGHSPSMTQPEVYFGKVREFLQGPLTEEVGQGAAEGV